MSRFFNEAIKVKTMMCMVSIPQVSYTFSYTRCLHTVILLLAHAEGWGLELFFLNKACWAQLFYRISGKMILFLQYFNMHLSSRVKLINIPSIYRSYPGKLFSLLPVCLSALLMHVHRFQGLADTRFFLS